MYFFCIVSHSQPIRTNSLQLGLMQCNHTSIEHKFNECFNQITHILIEWMNFVSMSFRDALLELRFSF